MMDTEDKYFSVTPTGDGLNVRSTGEFKDKKNDLGDFNLKTGDVIHAVGVVISGGTTFHKFDSIYRDGTRYDLPFNSFPMHVASPSGEYWTAEKGSGVWMTETNNPELASPLIKPVVDPLPTSDKKYTGWRVLHKAEGGYEKTPLNMPEVIPPENPVALPMTEDIQKMSFELMQDFNKAITAELWTKVHRHDKAFNNFNGFEKDGEPRANFITKKNLSSPLPKYDKMGRLCGGMFVRGIVQGNKLVFQPGIHGIDANKPMPSLQTIKDKNWYFFAVDFHEKGVGHFPQGKGGPVAIPFIFDREIRFPLRYFVPWDDDELPEATKLYIN
jgi:hypothetical protein